MDEKLDEVETTKNEVKIEFRKIRKCFLAFFLK